MKNLFSMAFLTLLFACEKSDLQFAEGEALSDRKASSGGRLINERVFVPNQNDKHEVDEKFKKLYKMESELAKFDNLLRDCDSSYCDAYQTAKNSLRSEYLAFKNSEAFVVKLYLSPKKAAKSCTFDNYTPDEHDPIKVMNLKFIYPVMEQAQTHANYGEDTNGAGSRWLTAPLYTQKMIEGINNVFKSNAKNDIEPGMKIISPRLLVRSVGWENPRIPLDQLDKYYFESPNSGSSWGHQIGDNLHNFKEKYATSQNHFSILFSAQKGSPGLVKGEFAGADGAIDRLPNGDLALRRHPHYAFTTSGYVSNLLLHRQNPLIVRINGWLGNAIHQKKSSKEPGTNKFKAEWAMGYWEYRGLLAHELGHALGLAHTWKRGESIQRQRIINPLKSGGRETASYECKDYPILDSTGWSTGSNNMMDYHPHQNNISPCQLKVMHWNLMNSTLENTLYKPLRVDRNYDITLPANAGLIEWDAPHHLIGNLHIPQGTTLKIGCSGTTIASDAKITVSEGGKLLGRENLQRRSYEKHEVKKLGVELQSYR